MATRRDGRAYLWSTWLAQLLGGRQCLWRVWFMSHFKYTKVEAQAFDLVQWNRDHAEMVQRRLRELAAQGYQCTVEDQNSFKIHGEAATLAGKPDIIARKPDHALVIDPKSGKQRDADFWQVYLYLYALPRDLEQRRLLPETLIGEVMYRDETFTLTPAELTERMPEIVRMIKVVSAEEAPQRVPSRYECLKCNIGHADCPERIGEREEAQSMVSEF